MDFSQLPTLNAEGKPQRVVVDGEFRIELDLSEQVLAVDAEKVVGTKLPTGVVKDDCDLRVEAYKFPLRKGQPLLAVADDRGGFALTAVAVVDGAERVGEVDRKFVTFSPLLEEPEILPTPDGAARSGFVSAGILTQKAKLFDDGLHAAVELAAQQGAGELGSKQALLLAVVDASSDQTPTRAAALLAAATMLGGQKISLPSALHAEALKAIEEFRRDPVRSKPIGFYSWSAALSAIFRQDRLLQTKLGRHEGVESLARVLAADAGARRAYEGYLELIARLTNPSTRGDLRALFPGRAGLPGEEEVSILPPSASYENTLLQKLFGGGPVPEDFDLMETLVKAVRSREVDLVPTEGAGWYAYQSFALETLICPERADEAARLQLGDEYRTLLTDLFRGALALARETHAKQLEVSMVIGERPEPRRQIKVSPHLSAEPLATHYRRRAEGYRLVRTTLHRTFGAGALKKLRRQSAKGPVQADLGTELDWMIDLFDGAAFATSRQLGMPGHDADGERAARRFLHWVAELREDPELTGDSRMMVPVWRTDDGRIKVWAFLGWVRRELSIFPLRPPSRAIFDRSGNPVASAYAPGIEWVDQREATHYPVTAEFYVRRLLDRDEFRRHCDRYRTRSAILQNLAG
jgi:hypothetical protein